MALVELDEDAIAEGLDRRDDEDAAEARRARGSARGARRMCSTLVVTSKVTSGKRRVELARDCHRMAGAVEEVGIAEGDVAGARGDLLLGVGEDDLLGTTKKRPS